MQMNTETTSIRRLRSATIAILLFSAAALMADQQKGQQAGGRRGEAPAVDTVVQSPQPITDDTPINPGRLGKNTGHGMAPKSGLAPAPDSAKKKPARVPKQKRQP